MRSSDEGSLARGQVAHMREEYRDDGDDDDEAKDERESRSAAFFFLSGVHRMFLLAILVPPLSSVTPFFSAWESSFTIIFVKHGTMDTV